MHETCSKSRDKQDWKSTKGCANTENFSSQFLIVSKYISFLFIYHQSKWKIVSMSCAVWNETNEWIEKGRERKREKEKKSQLRHETKRHIGARVCVCAHKMLSVRLRFHTKQLFEHYLIGMLAPHWYLCLSRCSHNKNAKIIFRSLKNILNARLWKK